MSFTAISLFTGAGGMDVGFSKAGFDVLWANDINADACATYSKNHKNPIRCGDLNTFFDEIENYKAVDLVFGGPPCQGFSVAGKMDPNDERSKLIFSFMDVIEKVQPKAFVMENVKALGALDKWKLVREKLFQRANELGFKFTQIVVLNATEFGVPQKRERMFFVGIKDPKGINELKGLETYLSKYKREASKLREVFKKLGPAGSQKNNRICNAKITLASKPILRKSPYAGMLFNGAGRPVDPNGYANTLPASMGGNKTPIIDENQVYKNNVSWIEQYHSGIMNGKEAAFCEAPKFLRRMTIDEALRIQTFPDNYEFCGKPNSIYTQIGNAVPCGLAFAVASALKDMMQPNPPASQKKKQEMPQIISADALYATA